MTTGPQDPQVPAEGNQPTPPDPAAPDPAAPGPYAPPPAGQEPVQPPVVPPAQPPTVPPVQPPVQPPAAPPVQPGYGAPQPPAYGATPPGYGATPPPAPGPQPPAYGQPPAGAYPPGSYPAGGYPAGGYPAAGYPAAPPAYGAPAAPPTVSEAFNFGWNKFKDHVGPILGVMAILVVGAALLGFLMSLLGGGLVRVTYDPYTGELRGAGMFSLLLFYVAIAAVVALATYILQAAIWRGGLDITTGQQLSFGRMFNFSWGNVILAGLLLAAGTFVGGLLCGVGAIVFGFFSIFTMGFVVDKNLGAWQALMASFRLVSQNAGTVVVLFLGTYLAEIIGVILCGVGLLVTMPVAILAQLYMFKRLQNEPVA